MKDFKTPVGWKLLEVRSDGIACMNKALGLAVICSENIEQDGNKWLHVSVSRRSKIPTYDDLALVKRLFMGDDLHAYQCFVASVDHVNIHPYCLHLWARSDGKPALPDFTNGTGSI
jgi:hypothetical protein